jgi:dynein heavy chain
MVVIDFTVTMKGLEEQLLAVVINKEKAELEETLNALINDINQNQKKLKELDAALLEKLATCDKEKILEDKELVETLSKVKTESKKVETTISNAETKQEQIKKERREYEEVSKLGSVL